VQLSEKITWKKKSTFSYRLLVLIFWKPISKLVNWQIFRIFGHSLTDWHRLEGRVWNSYRHFFQYWLFSLKLVPFTQFWTKSNNSNAHLRAFFMLYTIQIIKIKKYFFWPNWTQSKRPKFGVGGPKLKFFLFNPQRWIFFLTIFS
jgi:hypothetical protein